MRSCTESWGDDTWWVKWTLPILLLSIAIWPPTRPNKSKLAFLLLLALKFLVWLFGYLGLFWRVWYWRLKILFGFSVNFWLFWPFLHEATIEVTECVRCARCGVSWHRAGCHERPHRTHRANRNTAPRSGSWRTVSHYQYRGVRGELLCTGGG